MEIRTGHAGIDDATLYYEEAGRGFPIVLVHSAGADHHMWDEQFTVFAREYCTLRYDLRGYGRSFSNPIAYSHMNDLHGLLQARGIEQAFLIGSGLGSQIVLDFALARSRLTAGLVLVNPVARPPDTAPLGTAFRDDRNNLLPIDPAVVRRLGQIRIPCIVITGEQAGPEITRAARLLYTTIPDAIKANLPGAAQLPNIERPTQFNRIVLTFFDWIKSRWDLSALPSW